MKRIAVDMDNVLADITEQFIRYHEKEFGERKTIKEITGISELEAFPNARKYLYQQGFFATPPVIENSQQVLAELNKKYEVFIVSAAMEFPQSLPEKQQWLNEHFPFIQWQQMVFCGSKTIVQADIMIDDHFKNLDHFAGQTLLFSQPHNEFKDAGRHQRVYTWLEIADILLL